MVHDFDEMKKRPSVDAYILGVGYEGDFSYRSGADKAPKEIMNAFLNNMEVFDRFTETEPFYSYELGYCELKKINKQKAEKAIKRIKDNLAYLKDKFTIMLGGSHSISNAFFLFLAETYKPSDITILQIDAHPDMRENTNDYKENSSKYDHACGMRRACELGFKTVQVGIRTISIYDHEYITKNNLTVFEWSKGKEPTVEEIVSSIKTDKVYLTFDIDGLDPAHAPATGTPIPGGLSFTYAQKLIRELIKEKDLVGADIVEVAPFKDDVLTQYTAAVLCYNIISYKLLKEKNILKFVFN